LKIILFFHPLVTKIYPYIFMDSVIFAHCWVENGAIIIIEIFSLLSYGKYLLRRRRYWHNHG